MGEPGRRPGRLCWRSPSPSCRCPPSRQSVWPLQTRWSPDCRAGRRLSAPSLQHGVVTHTPRPESRTINNFLRSLGSRAPINLVCREMKENEVVQVRSKLRNKQNQINCCSTFLINSVSPWGSVFTFSGWGVWEVLDRVQQTVLGGKKVRRIPFVNPDNSDRRRQDKKYNLYLFYLSRLLLNLDLEQYCPSTCLQLSASQISINWFLSTPRSGITWNIFMSWNDLKSPRVPPSIRQRNSRRQQCEVFAPAVSAVSNDQSRSGLTNTSLHHNCQWKTRSVILNSSSQLRDQIKEI